MSNVVNHAQKSSNNLSDIEKSVLINLDQQDEQKRRDQINQRVHAIITDGESVTD